MKIYDLINILANLGLMIWKTILFLFLFNGITPSDDHAIYITVIEISIEKDPSKGNVTIKAFSDDLANALHNMSSEFAIKDDPIGAPDLLDTYIHENLQLKIDDKLMHLDMESITKEGETHWINVSFSVASSVSKVEIRTQWFTELFLTQQNIIKVKVDAERRYHRLSREHHNVHWIF